MGKGEKRFNINGLVPGEKYAIQVRAVDGGDNSQWSQKYHVTTIDDSAGGTRTPAPPNLISWEVNAAGEFVAVWASAKADNTNTDGTLMVVKLYELGISDGTTEVIMPHYGASGDIQSRAFNFGHLLSMFNNTLPTTLIARMRVINSAGSISEWTDTLTASLPVPNPPENVKAKPVIDGITITWDPPSDPIYLSGYRVYVGFAPDFPKDNTTLKYDGPAQEFTFGSGSYEVDHYFKVVSRSNPGLESTIVLPTPDPTRPKSPYGPDKIAPKKPTLASGTPPLDRAVLNAPKLNFSWSVEGDGLPEDQWPEDNQDISGFVIRWRVVGDENWRNAYFSKEARSGAIDVPRSFSNYEAQISAYDFVANYSDFAVSPDTEGPLVIIGASAPPGVVTSVTAIPRWDGMRLTWDASTDSVKYEGVYHVQYNTTGTWTDDTPNYVTPNTFIDIENLEPITTYFYRVRAKDSAAQFGPWSAVQEVKLPAFPSADATDGFAPQSAPQNVRAIGGLNYFNISWDRVINDDAVWYEVFASTTNDFTTYDNTTFVGESRGTSLLVTTLASGAEFQQGVQYYFKVRAMDLDCDVAQNIVGPMSVQATDVLTQVASADLGIDMGGENLYWNSSFDVDSDANGVANYWEVMNTTPDTEPVTPSLVTGRNGEGKAQRIEWTGLNTGTKGFRSRDSKVLRPNTEYIFSFYARGNGGTAFSHFANNSMVNAAWIKNPALTTTYQRYIFKATTPALAANVYPQNIQFQIVGHNVTGTTANPAWFEVDDAQVEAGNVVSSYKTGTVSIAKLATGRFNTADMIIATGGRIVSDTYLTNNTTGFLITDSGITIKDGQVDAKTLIAESTITNKLYVGNELEIATGGRIRSTNYSDGSVTAAAGFRIDSTSIDIRSGTVAADTFVGGTISAAIINLGADAKMIVDSATASIQSNNYNGPNDVGTNAGFKISNLGIEMWDTNSKINVNSLQTSTLETTTLTIGSGGTIQSKDWAVNGPVRWRLSENAFAMVGGTITGSTIITDQIYSAQNETQGGVTRSKFSINANGYAEFSGVYIYGNGIVGNGASHFIQSANYAGSGTGWKITGDGNADFKAATMQNIEIFGTAKVGRVDPGTSAMVAAGVLQSAAYQSGSQGWRIDGYGNAEFNNGDFRVGSAGGSSIRVYNLPAGSPTPGAQMRLYSPGDSDGGSFSIIRSEGRVLYFQGSLGGQIVFGGPASVFNSNVATISIGQDVKIAAGLNVENGIKIESNGLAGKNGLWVKGGASTSLTGNVDIGGRLDIGAYLDVSGTINVKGGIARFGVLSGSAQERYVVVNSNGDLGKGAGTSSRAVKKNIEDLDVDYRDILKLKPREYHYKTEDGTGPKSVGFIAEEAQDAGLDKWVAANSSGEHLGFDYPFFVVALQHVAREQQKEIDELKSLVEKLLEDRS